MKASHLLSSLLVLPVMSQYTNKKAALCMSAEEEAALLQKMMHEEGG